MSEKQQGLGQEDYIQALREKPSSQLRASQFGLTSEEAWEARLQLITENRHGRMVADWLRGRARYVRKEVGRAKKAYTTPPLREAMLYYVDAVEAAAGLLEEQADILDDAFESDSKKGESR